jgi:hypothetical protein
MDAPAGIPGYLSYPDGMDFGLLALHRLAALPRASRRSLP